MRTDPSPETAALAARIEHLERRLARGRRLAFAALLLAFAGLLVAAKRTPGPVVGSAFVLVDAQGETRGQLAVSEDGQASFLLRNVAGTGDAGFLVQPSGASALRLRSPKRTVTLEVADDGRGELRILQAHAKTAVSVGIDAAGQPAVVLNDKTGKVAFDTRKKK